MNPSEFLQRAQPIDEVGHRSDTFSENLEIVTTTLQLKIRALVSDALANCQQIEEGSAGMLLPQIITRLISSLEKQLHPQMGSLTKQHSVTNIVLVDGQDIPVVKIVLEKPLGFVARKSPQSHILFSAPQKAKRERERLLC